MPKNPIPHFKYLEVITAFFVAVLLISNVASTKITTLGPLTLDAGTILFPLTYIFGDILTEVYGYHRARKVIWLGLLTNILMAAIFMIVAVLPSAADWPNQAAYEAILGLTPRIVLASVVAYFAGEFINSFILAKMKVAMKGKKLWARTISSTLVGQLLDTALFIGIAFYGVLPMEVLIAIFISNYIFKVALEVLLTPVTYGIVNKLKKAENEDHFDKETNFNPFAVTSKD